MVKSILLTHSHIRICILLSLFSLPCIAQETILECTDSTFCIPSVAWMPRSKGIDINRETVYNYNIRSKPVGNYSESGSGEVSSNSRTEIKIKIPILLRENIKLAIGFKYFKEDYEFDDLDENSFPFYRSLDDKPLRSIGGTVYVVKPFKGNKFFLARVGVTLNGDYTRDDEFPTSDFMRFSLAPMIGWKKNL